MTNRAASPVRSISLEPSTTTYDFSPEILMVQAPNDPATEAIRALRTHVMAQHVQLGRRSLAVCGASEGVGCSFIATNLAVALSQIGVRTLLIEADLRRPSLQSMIRCSNPGPGLTQFLSSSDFSYDDVIRRDVIQNLSLLYAGGVSSSPQELLGEERFHILMEFCLREFDMTIVDTPSANTCSDARRISTVVGYSLIVARRNKSFIDDIKVLASQLEADRAKVVGTVLNDG
jgi:protein-tyrosine kinase